MAGALTAQDIIRIWELGRNQHPLDRALSILRVAYANHSRNELAALDIGRRDALLLEVRERTFGQALSGLVVCPACGEQVEFALKVADIRLDMDGEAEAAIHQMTLDGYALAFRLPNSLDLASLVGLEDAAWARQALAERCVVESSRDGEALGKEGLPEEVIEALSVEIAESAAQADIVLNISCPSCGHGWKVMFDIAVYLWTEISAEATRLLHQVYTLAQAFGWREADILSMSAARRRFYLDRLGQ